MDRIFRVEFPDFNDFYRSIYVSNFGNLLKLVEYFLLFFLLIPDAVYYNGMVDEVLMKTSMAFKWLGQVFSIQQIIFLRDTVLVFYFHGPDDIRFANLSQDEFYQSVYFVR